MKKPSASDYIVRLQYTLDGQENSGVFYIGDVDTFEKAEKRAIENRPIGSKDVWVSSIKRKNKCSYLTNQTPTSTETNTTLYRVTLRGVTITDSNVTMISFLTYQPNNFELNASSNIVETIGELLTSNVTINSDVEVKVTKELEIRLLRQ